METEFVLLQYENIPRWYELSFDEKTPAIVVKFHKDILRHLPSFKKCTSVESFLRDFNFSIFQDDFLGKNFGFEGAFQRIREENNFIVFSVAIPVLEKPVTKRCSNCYGGGRDLFGACSLCQGTLIENEIESCWLCNNKEKDVSVGNDCYICNGAGVRVKTVMDWHSFNAISATFALFFNIMYFGIDKDKAVTSDLTQLMLLQTSIQKGMNGAPIGGIYSVSLVTWLSRFPKNTKLVEVEDAMERTHRRIFGNFSDIDKMQTWADVRKDGWFSLSCPGDRTGLFPNSHFGISQERGYEFSCHNVDNSMQQLILLAGLAALCDIARREIK